MLFKFINFNVEFMNVDVVLFMNINVVKGF